MQQRESSREGWKCNGKPAICIAKTTLTRARRPGRIVWSAHLPMLSVKKMPTAASSSRRPLAAPAAFCQPPCTTCSSIADCRMKKIIDALATAGIIGNLIKTNASISGAECGCQAEVGSACSMAAAGLAELFAMEIDQIEYAAEVAMEHHLGLTCDPISGLVQIPCIERNAVAAMRAINALSLANFLTHTRKISFDVVIKTMYETGRDLFSKYRETSEGGLAKTYFE